jgi:hypothetical protein
MTEVSRRVFLAGPGLVAAATALPPAPAAAGSSEFGARAARVTAAGSTITLANDVLRVVLRYSGGSLVVTSVQNIAANAEYQSLSASLFSYQLNGSVTVSAGDGGWAIAAPQIAPITMYTRQGNRTVGQQVRIVLSRTAPRPMAVTAVFEIFDGRAGLRFSTLIRNGGTDNLTITNSTVIALGFADRPHTLHYVPNAIWSSTRGSLAPLPAPKDYPKKAVSVYDGGHGWSVSPELNWKGMRGHGDVTTDYMLPPYASLDIWSGSDHVRVLTNPAALQLVLFPQEEFEYLAVNLTVFAGDIVAGRMADAEHFRKRFRYNNTSTLFHTNDWDYRGGPGRELPPDYYYTTVSPKALAAGLDMVMLDDLWNTTRDSIEPSDAMKQSIHSLGEFSSTLASNGLLLGLWFSLTGGGHGEGRDLADPSDLAFKRGQIETLITQYKLTHQMIDLTEYWQTEQVTSYSHPSDSAYRKAVLARRLMNDLVQLHPQLLPKMTSELDVFPTQGDRNNGLIHVCHNGWNTANGGVTGENLSLRTALTGFGHLPMESAYMNGGAISGRMEDYYSYLAVRTVKFPKDPGNTADWPAAGISLMAKFNAWRRSPRIHALTEELFRPVFLGPGWDSSSWDSSVGPYIWMYTSGDAALVIATGSGGAATGAAVTFSRWLPAGRYLAADITLDDSGSHSYAFRGVLASTFPIDLKANTSRGKAFWITRVTRAGLQVIYADENVTSYTLTGSLLRATGSPGAIAAVIVADPDLNRGLVVNVPLDNQGQGSAVVGELVPPQPVATDFALPSVFQAESLSRTVSDGVAVSQVNEANAAAGGWILAAFTAVGQRIEYAIDVPAADHYRIDVRFKSNASRGRSRSYLDGVTLGPEIDHYYPGRVYQGLEFRTRELGVVPLGAGRHTLAFESTGTSGTSYAVGVDSITLTPTVEGSPIGFEDPSGSSIPLTHVAEAAASGAAFDILPATAAGEWIEYSLVAPKAGRYRLAATTKRTANRGQASVQVAGVTIAGRMVDFYLPPSDGDYQYLDEDLGTVDFAAAGAKTVRFTVTGKAGGSTGYQLAVDRLALTPIPSITLTGPSTVRVAQSTRFTTDFDSTVLWSVDGADSGSGAWVDATGLVTGRQRGTATVRVRSQLDRTVAAALTITVV